MMFIVLIVANTIGSIPLIVAFIKASLSNPEISAEFAKNQNFSVLGLDSNVSLFMMLMPFVAGLAAFILIIKPLHEKNFTVVINGTGKIRWKRYFTGAIVWLFLSAVYLLLYLEFDPSNFSLNNTSKSLLILTVVATALIPFQAALEEVLFRGYLMQGFANIIRNRWFPLVMTSLLFALLHSVNPEVKKFGFFTMMPHYILFGLTFGIATILDDGIEVAMGAHAANNIFLSLMVTQESSALQTESLFEQQTIYPWIEFAGLVLMGVLFILILKKLLGWKNFSALIGKIEEPAETYTAHRP